MATVIWSPTASETDGSSFKVININENINTFGNKHY